MTMKKTKKVLLSGIGSFLALAALITAGCGSSSGNATTSASPRSNNTLIVFGAGTLANPFSQEIAAFQKLHPGITTHSLFGASGNMVKRVTELQQPCDVLGTADYSLIPKDMFGAKGSKRYADWYLGFVSNEITFAYTSHSKGAAQLTSQNWYKILAEPGVKIGRSNPASDPSGYQILQMLKLAQGYYRDPNLSASILKNSPAASAAETETSLIGALQSGQIDYLAIYRSDALQNHFKYIKLPAAINLADPALAKTYATVSVPGVNGPTTGKPIIYGLTVPTNAPDPTLAREFVAFVLSPRGQAIMQANGFVTINPALASSQTALPASLRPLTRPWQQ